MHDCIKSVVVICCVIDRPSRTIGISEAVPSSHHVPISSFVLALGVSRVMVVDVVCERVSRMRIEWLHPSVHHRHGHLHHVARTWGCRRSRHDWRRRWCCYRRDCVANSRGWYWMMLCRVKTGLGLCIATACCSDYFNNPHE